MMEKKEKTLSELADEQTEKGKYELDSVQEHFLWSNEPLIDGIPMSQFFDMLERKIK